MVSRFGKTGRCCIGPEHEGHELDRRPDFLVRHFGRRAQIIIDLEQHQPDWNTQGDKVARENTDLERADGWSALTVCGQPERDLV
jgi:hypothetical protein